MISSSFLDLLWEFFISRYLYNADNCFLILTREKAVALNIRTEDGGEFPFKALGGYEPRKEAGARLLCLYVLIKNKCHYA